MPATPHWPTLGSCPAPKRGAITAGEGRGGLGPALAIWPEVVGLAAPTRARHGAFLSHRRPLAKAVPIARSTSESAGRGMTGPQVI